MFVVAAVMASKQSVPGSSKQGAPSPGGSRGQEKTAGGRKSSGAEVSRGQGQRSADRKSSEAGSSRGQGQPPVAQKSSDVGAARGSGRPSSEGIVLNRDSLRRALSKKKQDGGPAPAASKAVKAGGAAATASKSDKAPAVMAAVQAAKASAVAIASKADGTSALATGGKVEKRPVEDDAPASKVAKRSEGMTASASKTNKEKADLPPAGRSASEKGKEKRKLEDASPSSRPSKVLAVEGPSCGPEATNLDVDEASLGDIFIPQWRIRERSSVTTRAVAREMFEQCCLFPDLEELAEKDFNFVVEEYASCWAKVTCTIY